MELVLPPKYSFYPDGLIINHAIRSTNSTIAVTIPTFRKSGIKCINGSGFAVFAGDFTAVGLILGLITGRGATADVPETWFCVFGTALKFGLARRDFFDILSPIHLKTICNY
jgi:hypothetical protein